MKSCYLFISLLFSIVSFAQSKPQYLLIDQQISKMPVRFSNSTENIAHYINSNFKTADDKIRAVFYWTASNISYDLKNMYNNDFAVTPQERINKTLQSKKGVCIDYASVFNSIANKVGIETVIIEGYTKQNGQVSDLAHAWCASKIEGQWYLFDPTWGSGGIINGRFLSKINDNYYKVSPLKSISSHMPFDYLWQFLNYPITNGEFYEAKTQINKTKKYFDFDKEIIKYNSLSEADQLFDTAERIGQSGLRNPMIVERYEGKKNQLVYLRQNANVRKLNAIVIEMNEAVVLLNDFIHYRNNMFKPTFSDNDISNMIQTPKEKLVKCQNDIYSLGSVGKENAANVASIKKTIGLALAQAEEHSLFVKNYLSKSKMVRKTMFSKVSWFGASLN